jgi:endonuclease IV
VVRGAGAPVVCETPEAGLAEDIDWLRQQIS